MTHPSLPAATTTAQCKAVLDEIGRVVVGKRWALTLILTSVLARGHVLIEDLPGLGKTLIARSFAAALGLEFTRVQFTPDLLPADLLGSTVYDMQSGRFEFRSGPTCFLPTRSTGHHLRLRRRCSRRWPKVR
jgi:MoxR-like ATPase